MKSGNEVKFRSENLLENGNKNRWNLPCGELLLSLIRTRSFGEKESSSSFLHSKVASHRFLFPFSSKFSDLNFTSYVLYIFLYYVTCHTQWAWVTYGHGFESRWSPDFFQPSSFQLLKLENSLRGSFFTFRVNYETSELNNSYEEPQLSMIGRNIPPRKNFENGGSKTQVTGHGSRVTGHGSQVTGHRLLIINFLL